MREKYYSVSLLRLFLAASMIILAGCGSDEGDTTNVTIQNPDVRENEVEQERYSTQPMITINNKVENDVDVVSKAEVDNDDVVVRVICRQADADVIHRQYIYSGTRCPTLADDRNGDGVIDWQEASQVVGPVLITLDSDIMNQEQEVFFSQGNYVYERRASFTELLRLIPADQNLSLNGRVVMVYGVSPSRALPTTVSTPQGLTPNESIPIACGTLKQTTTENRTQISTESPESEQIPTVEVTESEESEVTEIQDPEPVRDDVVVIEVE